MYMQKIDVITQAFISLYEFDYMWLAAAVIKHMLTAHFEQRAIIKSYANSGMTPTETWKFFRDISRGKRVLGRLFLTCTRDFGKIEWASVTISGERNPVFPTALRTFTRNFGRSVHDIVDITGLSLGMVEWQDLVYTLIKMNTINELRDI